MAESKVTYEIIIRSDGGSGSGSGTGTNGSGATVGTTEEMGFLESSYNIVSTIKGFAPIAAGAAIAKNIFQWRLSLIGRDTGNAHVQQKIDTAMGFAAQGVAIGAMLIGGIATANPLMLLGAATGIATSVLSLAKEREQFEYERREESVALRFSRERAGGSWNRSRTG